MMMDTPKRLIEEDLPIARISAHARREKSIRHGHISTLHIWWARRPLAACRAVILASLWPEPVDLLRYAKDHPHPEGDLPHGAVRPELFLSSAREIMQRWADESLSIMASDKGDMVRRNRTVSDESVKALTLAKKDPAWLAEPAHLRTVLLDFIADFADWDVSTNPDFLAAARALTHAAHLCLGGEPHTRPLVIDPFAGGGSIPLEALRIGADAFASDLNPIPVLLNKVVLEYIPRFGQRLADEVRRWGSWIKDRAQEELAAFYPPQKTKVDSYTPAPEATRRIDGQAWQLAGIAAETPIAYLWARTVLSEAPGQGEIPVEVPLMRSLWLAKKSGRKVALRWVRDEKGKVKTRTVEVNCVEDGQSVPRRVKRPLLEIFEPKKDAEVEGGTVARGNATCPVSGHVTRVDSVRAQLKKRRGGAADARLFAVVTTLSTQRALSEGGESTAFDEQGRFYRLPKSGDEAAFAAAATALEELKRGEPRRHEGHEEEGKNSPQRRGERGEEKEDLPRRREGREEDLLEGVDLPGVSVVPDELISMNELRRISVPIYGMVSWGDLFSPRQALALATLARLVRQAGALMRARATPASITAPSGQDSGTFAGMTQAAPQIGEDVPRTGEGVPSAGEHVPRTGEHVPRTGEGVPRTGEHVPRTGEGAERTVGGVERTIRGAERTVGGVERTIGGVERTIGGVERTAEASSTVHGMFAATEAGADKTVALLPMAGSDPAHPGGPSDSTLTDGSDTVAGLAEAVQTCLGLCIGRIADLSNALCGWKLDVQCPTHLFSRQAIGMMWDYSESVCLCDSSGSWQIMVERMYETLKEIGGDWAIASAVELASATAHPLPDDSAAVLVTDPPYYDAVPYAYLSDFFYVWLRRTLGGVHPALFTEGGVPKDAEIVVDRPHALSQSNKDIAFYERELARAFAESRRVVKPDGIGCIVFASKSTASWEAILKAVIDAGWIITGSWPIDTEMETRVAAQGQARLGSSVHIVVRPRELPSGEVATGRVGEWRAVLEELPVKIRQWMPRLASEGVVGADAIFACLGPALEIYSRYSRVERASGEVVQLSEYLEQVWAVVSTEALSLIFEDADAGGLEPDARLTAMWLWTLGGGKPRGGEAGAAKDDADEADDEEEGGTSAKTVRGFVLEFDAARKIAQGLGVHLDKCQSFVEVKGETARLLAVAERVRELFGKDASAGAVPTEAAPKGKRKKAEPNLFQSLEEVKVEIEKAEAQAAGKLAAERVGATVLDRVHQSMLLFSTGRGEALRRFVVEDGVGKDARFWKLADSLSKLYPAGTDEKRWVDGVLARKKSFGF